MHGAQILSRPRVYNQRVQTSSPTSHIFLSSHLALAYTIFVFIFLYFVFLVNELDSYFICSPSKPRGNSQAPSTEQLPAFDHLHTVHAARSAFLLAPKETDESENVDAVFPHVSHRGLV